MELRALMQSAGIIGAGGAGFPSYAKLAGGADTLLVNGSECEPLLYTDFTLLSREMSIIKEGISVLLREGGFNRALLCLKAHTAKLLSLSEGEEIEVGTRVKILPDSYPIGDEVSLVFEATGRVIRPGSLPKDVGVVVYNVETVYNVARAALYSEGVLDKWVSVGGDIENKTVIKVPLGTRVADIFEKLGITVDDSHAVIDGGPSMGKIIDPMNAVVKKTTKGLLVLPKSTQAVMSKLISEKMSVARAETACCQCTRCTDMCPRHLLGYALEPHKMVRTAMQAAKALPEMVKSASLCCGCGICETLACSQGISPRAVINNYKALLAENKMRFISEKDVYARVEREYRMIPATRWASALGVRKFDTPPTFGGKIGDFERVEILLRPHVGAPSIPSVKSGEVVTRGQIIATSADGLSTAQHASIDGKVTLLNDKILIQKVN